MLRQDFHQGERYGPGIYAFDGALHIDEEEFILGTNGNPEDPRDVAIARRAIGDVCDGLGIPVAMEDRP